MKCLCAAIALYAAMFSANAAPAAGIALGLVIEETPQGIEVKEVLPGGIADRCMPRLRPGAYIVTLNGMPVPSALEFKRTIETSDSVRFEFVDPKGEFRWARAWSRGHAPADAAACCTIASPPALPAPPFPGAVPRPLPPLPPPQQP
jgi:hypothetical protein